MLARRIPLLALLLSACGSSSAPSSGPEIYVLDASAQGAAERVDNVASVTVVSSDPNLLRAEYRAGFVQGKLQAKGILAARDNDWDAAYLVDPGHHFPTPPRSPPTTWSSATRRRSSPSPTSSS